MKSNPLRQTPTAHDIATDPWPWPHLVAHRCGGFLAPENTLAACRSGHEHGFQMMEYDVKLSRDGVPILLHDDTLQRTSSGNGAAHLLDMPALLRHDFGAWHSPAYAGEPIPALYSIASYTIAHGIHSNIEIKPTHGTDAETGHAIALIARELWSGARLPPLLSSFSEVALAAAQAAAPELPRALLMEGIVPDDWPTRARRLGCHVLNLNHRHIHKELIHDIRSAGYAVAAWTVNDATRAQQLLQWGCNAIITDRLDTINPAAYPYPATTDTVR